jgi:hypothetical protein
MSGLYKKEVETPARDRTVVGPAVQVEVGPVFPDTAGMEVPGICVSVADADYE